VLGRGDWTRHEGTEVRTIKLPFTSSRGEARRSASDWFQSQPRPRLMPPSPIVVVVCRRLWTSDLLKHSGQTLILSGHPRTQERLENRSPAVRLRKHVSPALRTVRTPSLIAPRLRRKHLVRLEGFVHHFQIGATVVQPGPFFQSSRPFFSPQKSDWTRSGTAIRAMAWVMFDTHCKESPCYLFSSAHQFDTAAVFADAIAFRRIDHQYYGGMAESNRITLFLAPKQGISLSS
jgi:hypothetical protein